MIKPLSLDNSIILDTETTGLDDRARIVEITLIDGQSGDVVYTSLVNPKISIPADATAIHGITDADVADAPTFDKIWNDIKGFLIDSTVYVYNLDYDYRLIAQSLAVFKYPIANLEVFFSAGDCVMCWYAAFYGEWNHYRETFKWQSLTNACIQQDVDVSDLKAHRAQADCEMTRRLIHAVNAKVTA